MVRRNKPIMGTRLVPSIENIEGCYKYGGRWDRRENICYEGPISPIDGMASLHYLGCMAPIKGVNLCWGAKEIAEEKYRPYIDFVLNKTGDVIHTRFLPEDADPKIHAKDMYSWAKESDMRVLPLYEESRICCNPRGRKIGCDEPNAIITNNGENIPAIAHNYRNKFGNRVISDLLPVKRKYIEKKKDVTVGTGFGYLGKIPALRSQKDSDLYFSMYDKTAGIPTRQINLKKEFVTVRPKRELVPNVETPAGCFAWGGMWDKRDEICLDKKGWGTAPIKGVECGWGAMETECPTYDPETREEDWVSCYEPYVTCEMLDENGEPMRDERFFVHDTMGTGYFDNSDGYQEDYDEAYDEAKTHGIEIAKDIQIGSGPHWNINYYTPWGEPCDSDHPYAVAAQDKEDVVEIYKRKLHKFPEIGLPKKITSHMLKSQRKIM